jgi:hypothetical protein
MIELFYALQRSRERKNHLKRSKDAKTRVKTRSRGFFVRKQKFHGGSGKKSGT